MPRTANVLLIAAAIMCCLLAHRARADDGADKETAKIEALIKHVEALDGAKFIRNGTAYDAKTAGKFLRAKWDRNKDEVKTAGDFIEKLATKSSTSGKPYMIRFKDGKEVESGGYLTEQLKKL